MHSPNLRDNRVLWIVLGIVLSALTCVLAWPPLRELFRFGVLHGADLAFAAGIGLLVLIVLNAAKLKAPLARRLQPKTSRRPPRRTLTNDDERVLCF
mgnify:CR=1 FL=1